MSVTDPASSAANAITAAGITIFGISIGLQPDILLAGFWGAVWSMTYIDKMPIGKRAVVTCTSTIIAGYATAPVFDAITGLQMFQSNSITPLAKYVIAIGIGFTAHKIIGPAILRLSSKKIDEIMQ